MKLETHIDVGARIRRHRITGSLDLVALGEAVRAIRLEPGYDPSFAALWDLRDAVVDVTADDVRRLADLVAGLSHEPVRSAIVVSKQAAYGLARMYDQLVRSRTAGEGGVFYSLDEAEAWLASAPGEG